MILKAARPTNISQLKEENFDFFIAASGYESRSTCLAQKLDIKMTKKIVLSFAEKKTHKQRILNDKYFKSLDFTEYNASQGSYSEIINVLTTIFKPYQGRDTLNILVDYSCMTKVWYATIINFFQNKESDFNKIRISFSYSPSIYSEPQQPMPNKYMGPIPGIFRISASNRPTALIVGLGYEFQRAKGIIEYLDPDLTYGFYSSPAFDNKFEQKVIDNNKRIFTSLPKEQVIPYPVEDLKSTDELLTSLCQKLGNEYRIILAPLGPKPFALICLLLAARYKNIDVWRVSSGSSGNVYDRKPADTDPVLCDVIFVSEKKEELVV